MTTTYSRPLGEWPLLLCGPMLRRVTPSSVAVFIATSQSCSVRLKVQNSAAPSSPWAMITPAQATRQIGERLHVLAIELTGIQLQQGIVYIYDVEMTPTSGSTVGPAKGLADQADLLSGPFALGYRDTAYPSFCLAPGLASVRILHGSCRKPHGGGPDALVIADELLREAWHRHPGNATAFAAARPHLLLLTGDQIYADDVAAPLLVSLRSAAKDLMGGFTELFPPGNLDLQASVILPGEARMEWLKVNSKLSSGEGDNHLMFLGEFYAMYLFCWSDVLWPTQLLGRTVFLEEDQLYPSRDDEEHPQKAEHLQEALDRQSKALPDLIEFAAHVARVRRVLANVPTMMAFDDHEISDDWNLDKTWNKAARGDDQALNRIVRNGLAAFAVFQSWGNDPPRFAHGKGKELLDALSAPSSSAAVSAMPAIISAPHGADTLLDIGPTEVASNSARVLWDWMLDGDGYRVIALDSRTHRDFDDAAHVGLLKPSEIVRQLVAHRPSGADPRLCFVIGPAPVVGHPLLEEFAQPLAAHMSNPLQGPRDADLEAWSANRACMEALLHALADFGAVVVLSGDVHYAYTNHTAYHAAAAAQGAPLLHARIVQLCCSALKNCDDMTKIIQQAGYVGFEHKGRAWYGTRRPPGDITDLLRLVPDASAPHPWDAVQIVSILDAYGVSLKFHEKLGVLLSRYPARVARNLIFATDQTDTVDQFLVKAYWLVAARRLSELPLVLPDGPWFTQPGRDKVTSYFLNDPDWWNYKTSYVRDVRTDESLLAMVGLDAVAPSSAFLRTSEAIIRQAHSVVGMPNIGEIRVAFVGSTTPQIEHRLHWWLPNRHRAMTVHVAPLWLPLPGAVHDQIPELY